MGKIWILFLISGCSKNRTYLYISATEIATIRAISYCRAKALFWLWCRRSARWPAASWKGCSSDISSGCKSAWATMERWPWWVPVSWLPAKRSFASAAGIVVVGRQTFFEYILYKKLCLFIWRSRSQLSPRDLFPFAVFFREHRPGCSERWSDCCQKPGGAKQPARRGGMDV